MTLGNWCQGPSSSEADAWIISSSAFATIAAFEAYVSGLHAKYDPEQLYSVWATALSLLV